MKLDVQIYTDKGAGLNIGMVCAANEDRFTASTFSEEVANFIVGVAGAELEPLRRERDILMPPVRSARRSEFKKSKGGLAFLADLDDTRAIGADFNKVGEGRETEQFRVPNRGLTITIDRDDYYEGIENDYALYLTAILYRNDIRRGLGLLDAAASNTAVVWNAAGNPNKDMRTMLNDILTERGLFANTVIAGHSAWAMRSDAYEASDKAGALLLANRTPDELAATLGVDTLHISKSVFKSAKGGAKAQMVSNRVFAYFRDIVANKDDASNIKRFYCDCQGGGEIGVYVDDSRAKTIDITVEQYSLPAVTDATGIEKLTTSAA